MDQSYDFASSFRQENLVFLLGELRELACQHDGAAGSNCIKIFFIKVRKLLLAQYWFKDVQNAVGNR